MTVPAMDTLGAPRASAPQALWLLLMLPLVLLLLWQIWTRNLERACTLKEWPMVNECARAAGDLHAQALRLQQRAARNPGDSQAWVELAVLSHPAGALPEVDHDAALDTAVRLAPQDPRVQRLQALRALQQQRWSQAVDSLIRLAQDSDDGQAAQALARLMREPQAMAAMQAQVLPGTRWLGPVLDAMPQAGVPMVLAMPLVAAALAQRGVSPAMLKRLMRELKAGGQWLEARALWTTWLGRAAPLVFNGDFNQGFIDGGFDWEITPSPPSRAGAIVRLVPLTQHGGVLQVDFTGRPVAMPVLRQPVVALHHKLSLSGQIMTSKLRTMDGLAWIVSCLKDGREVARTPALRDTDGRWQSFRVDFEAPADCGVGLGLQLQTYAAYEANVGLRGRASFDDLKMETRR